MRHAWLLMVLCGCPRLYPRYEPVNPPPVATPIEGLNTEWDDYNAAKDPSLDHILYSTNRGSRGKDLDVWIAHVKWGTQPRVTGEPQPYQPELMSPADERGPIEMSVRDFVADAPASGALAFTSARDGGAGGLDLYWGQTYPTPVVHRLDHLSSTSNDAYMTDKFGDPSAPRVLFASDRTGTGYDIYEALWDTYQIGGPPLIVKKLDALSGSSDDTAPFAGSSLDPASAYGARNIVFASQRDGGRGGWDLWCSHYDGTTTYTEPIPIAVANTEHDEFRPSVWGRFLMFSSNRPGGRGGYDLYTVQFDGCRPNGGGQLATSP